MDERQLEFGRFESVSLSLFFFKMEKFPEVKFLKMFLFEGTENRSEDRWGQFATGASPIMKGVVSYENQNG